MTTTLHPHTRNVPRYHGRSRFRARRTAAVTAALGLLLAGCGDDGGSDDGAGTLPLLGTEGEVPDRPALAVKIDATERGRPQVGLASADVVYEEMVEGGLTRLLAVYHSEDPDTVGPVRSARSTDISVLGELGRPLFAWSGANPTFAAAVEAADLGDVGVGGVPGAYTRDPERPAPYDLFASPEELRSAGAGETPAEPPPPLFDRRPADESLDAPGAEDATTVELSGGDLRTAIAWEWDGGSGTWQRSQDGTPHEDADGEQVAADNVVVRITPYVDSGVRDSTGAVVPEADPVGSGDALVLSDGQTAPARWEQEAEGAPTTYTDTDGDPLELAPGRTWVELLPPGALSDGAG